jgi:hypothetical protein
MIGDISRSRVRVHCYFWAYSSDHGAESSSCSIFFFRFSSIGAAEKDGRVIEESSRDVERRRTAGRGTITSTDDDRCMNVDFIPAWANAIAQFEGFGSPSNRAARNNNPGNLNYAGQAGAIGQDSGGFAIFPDDATGFQALYNQLTRYVQNYPNDSILDITAHYLGQSSPAVNAQGDAFTYAAFVASALGVTISTTLAQLVGSRGSTLPDLSASPTEIPYEPGVSIDAPTDNTGRSAGTPAGDAITLLIVLGVGAWLITRSWGWE